MANLVVKRVWELDIIRFVALVLMIVQHTVIIWTFMKASEFVEYPVIFDRIGRVGALLFLLLVGMSGFLSYSSKIHKTTFLQVQKIFLIRGVKIFGWALIISIVSFLVVPMKPIWYGVLHFIGTAIMTLPFFIQYKWVSRAMIFLGLVAGAVFAIFTSQQYLWLPLGIQPAPFYSLDYWPYFPWISLVLTGVELARALFSSTVSQTLFSESMPRVLKPIQWLGSHTLLLYLIHVPIIVGVVWLLQRGLSL